MLKFINNNKAMMLSGDPTMDPGFDEYDITRVEFPITKEQIYDEMCRLLTDYEGGSDMVTEYELYDMLVKIQRHWENVITVQND